MTRFNRRAVLKGLAAGGAALGFSTPASAGRSRCRLNWRKELNEHKPSGRPVVNATQEVVNDIDHGVNGYWAYLEYRRTLQAWETGDEFQAIVTYNGRFDGVEGARSYTGGKPLTGDEDGTIHGGYAMSIDGTLKADPAWPTHGFVGTTDYEGTISDTDDDGEMERARWNPVRWQDQYFSISSEALDWWGWIYEGGDCGTLVAAAGGRCGDIVCE